MALAHGLAESGYKPEKIRTIANVALDKVGDGFAITKINLATKAFIKGINLDEFNKIAEITRKECPVSKALKSVDIQLDAELVSE
jgi:osmotically inducible protein OsmC